MKRPTVDERHKTIETLSEKLKVQQYERGHDAMGMLDLSPEALQTTQDSLRAIIARGIIHAAVAVVLSLAHRRNLAPWTQGEECVASGKNTTFEGDPSHFQ